MGTIGQGTVVSGADRGEAWRLNGHRSSAPGRRGTTLSEKTYVSVW